MRVVSSQWVEFVSFRTSHNGEAWPDSKVSPIRNVCDLTLLQMVILRSSQPLTGTNNRRCKEDEQLVNAVLGIGRRGYILDTRAQSIAKAALQKGEFSVQFERFQLSKMHFCVIRDCKNYRFLCIFDGSRRYFRVWRIMTCFVLCVCQVSFSLRVDCLLQDFTLLQVEVWNQKRITLNGGAFTSR